MSTNYYEIKLPALHKCSDDCSDEFGCMLDDNIDIQEEYDKEDNEDNENENENDAIKTTKTDDEFMDEMRKMFNKFETKVATKIENDEKKYSDIPKRIDHMSFQLYKINDDIWNSFYNGYDKFIEGDTIVIADTKIKIQIDMRSSTIFPLTSEKGFTRKQLLKHIRYAYENTYGSSRLDVIEKIRYYPDTKIVEVNIMH
ncbi:MAG: hypothetical protein Edafosvirus2_12 [Edafosvirus sp.]|uniref:Uncharacterized protein n=1 Tax=Edafosvirus sp. TaxID=2487765 RepID=A0A3G4ZW39_9VIRU|nr:MAG: hypothetical protein Edafosvirus2_12 [Edafosvirus sp.]